jgi:N-acetylmuramoyl-L-alanine amidase
MANAVPAEAVIILRFRKFPGGPGGMRPTPRAIGPGSARAGLFPRNGVKGRMALHLTDVPSPNSDDRAGPVDILVLHYTGMESAEAALARLCDPAAKVSAHYLIDEAGRVFALVDEARCAWHAGVACWAGERDVNSRAIGVELANPGHEFGYRDFPEAQMAALVGLALGILARHPIPPHRVLAHSDVAPARKQDPGERFDWARCAREGVGLYPPDGLPKPDAPPGRDGFLRDLARFGYDTSAPDAAIEAFRRHFHAHAVGFGPAIGIGDAARLRWLLERAAAG